MIVDTSALVAIVEDESGRSAIEEAISHRGLVPAPVVVEAWRVITHRGSRSDLHRDRTLNLLLSRLDIVDFTAEDARIAAEANVTYGSGDGRGGTLNLLDLMVYAVAKRTKQPILCTGKDFATTDADIHPASRRW